MAEGSGKKTRATWQVHGGGASLGKGLLHEGDRQRTERTGEDISTSVQTQGVEDHPNGETEVGWARRGWGIFFPWFISTER